MSPEALAAFISSYGYAILFPIALIEGPLIMTVSGFLLRLDYFSFWPLYLVLMAGDLTADVLWYGVGRYGGAPFVRKYGKYVNLTESLLEKTEAAFHHHQNKILFLSKITMGFGFALVVLVAAGAARIPFKKYLSFNVLGQTIWTAVLIGIGYFFGNLYLVINEGIRTAALIAGVVIFIAFVSGIGSYLRKRDIQSRL